MNSVYAIVLVGFVSSCYAANPLTCYACQSDNVNNAAPGCFDPFDPSGTNVRTGNCVAASISLNNINPKGLNTTAIELSRYQKAAPDFQCGAIELQEPNSGLKQITRSCFLKEGANECDDAKKAAEAAGLKLTKCLLCETNRCNSAGALASMMFLTFVSSAFLFVLL